MDIEDVEREWAAVAEEIAVMVLDGNAFWAPLERGRALLDEVRTVRASIGRGLE